MTKNNALDKKAKQVKEILLMPIDSIKHSYKTEISRKNDIIISTQLYGTKYKRALDPDMSDIAIEYYEILYKDTILKDRKLLDNDGYIRCPEFAGDTAFTVKSLYGTFIRKEALTKKNLCSILSETSNKLHCLANFWIIPMEHGRTTQKLNSYDSPDFYLSIIRSDYAAFMTGFPSYFSQDLSDLIDAHFFEEDIVRRRMIINKDERIFGAYIDAIDNRASAIAVEKEDELWDCFNKHGFFDSEKVF